MSTFFYEPGMKNIHVHYEREESMNVNDFGVLLSIIVYLAGMVWIGFKVMDRNKTVGDFYLGGRKLGPFVTAMSAEASDMSSWLLMGIPGLAYLSGIADAGWTIIGLAIGTYLNWLIVAKRLRQYSEKIGAITIPEFFSKRFHDTSHILMFVAAVWIIVFFIPYTASGFVACGKLFNSLFGIDYHFAMIVSALVIVIYTMLGGFLAASTTDFIQSIIMSIALLIVVCYGIGMVGGLDIVFSNASSLPGYLSFTSSYDVATNSSISYTALTIISKAAWGLGYFGMPHILLRFMAIDDHKKLVLSRRVATIWVVISMAVSIFIGIVALSMSKAGIIDVLVGADSETAIVRISHLLSSHGFIFALIAGLIISGILASTMSTSDSQLLAASSSVSNDILTGFLKVKYSQKKLLNISRICLVTIALIGMVLAWDPNSSVFSIVSFAWAGFGASFGPVVLLALYWKRSNKWGALCGMLSGGITVFVWHFLIVPFGGVFSIYELLPGFVISILINVLVSLLTGGSTTEIQAEFDEVKGMD